MKEKLREIKTKLTDLSKLKGSPYFIAMGAAAGIFWNFIPSLGVGPFLSVGTAKLVKASGIAAVTVNLATGFFIPFMYSLNMLVGRTVMQRDVTSEELSDTLQKSLQESLDGVEGIASEPSRYFILTKLQSFSTEFFVGGFINAVIAATLVYLFFWLLLSYRRYFRYLNAIHQRNKKTAIRKVATRRKARRKAATKKCATTEDPTKELAEDSTENLPTKEPPE